MNAYASEVLPSQAFTGICDPRILPSVSIGGNLKRLRERAGMTQDALGRAASVKQSDISKWEKKGQVPTIPPLLRLASALSVSVDDLIEGVNPDYDRVIASAKSTQDENPHVKNQYGMTYPDTPPAVQDTHTLRSSGDVGVFSNADTATAIPHRLAQSDAVEIDSHQLREIDRRVGIVAQLDEAAATIASIAAAVRHSLETPARRRAKTQRADSHQSVPRREARRGGRK